MSTAPGRAKLEAYVDGALPPEEAARVEAHLARTPADRRFVEQLTEMNALLGAAYAAPMHASVPPELRATLAPRRWGRGLRPWWRPVGIALAASVALAVGVAIGQRTVEPAPVLAAGPVAPASPLHELLETAPSGRTAALPSGAATLVASFRDGDDRPCRELEVAHERAPSLTRAVACRELQGWSVLVAIAEPVAADARQEIVPASGLGDSALAVVLDGIGAGMVLAPDAEAELIAEGWRR